MVQHDISLNTTQFYKCLYESFKLAVDRPHLEKIMVWPVHALRPSRWTGCDDVDQTVRHWESDVLDALFGKDFARVIDLTDADDVNSANFALSRTYEGINSMEMIEWATNLYDGRNRCRLNCWEEIVTNSKVTWLKAHYDFEEQRARPAAGAATSPIEATGMRGDLDHGGDDDGYDAEPMDNSIQESLDSGHIPVDVTRPSQINLENPWIRDTLAKMPALLPVVIFARVDDAYMSAEEPIPSGQNIQRRSVRNEGDPEPEFVFNEESECRMRNARSY